MLLNTTARSSLLKHIHHETGIISFDQTGSTEDWDVQLTSVQYLYSYQMKVKPGCPTFPHRARKCIPIPRPGEDLLRDAIRSSGRPPPSDRVGVIHHGDLT